MKTNSFITGGVNHDLSTQMDVQDLEVITVTLEEIAKRESAATQVACCIFNF